MKLSSPFAHFPIVIATAVLPSLAIGQVTITDGTFADADWSQTTFQYGPNGGGGSPMQTLVGGNPGAARIITTSCGAFFSGAYNAQYLEAFRYDPAVGGPLSALSFSIDSRFQDGLQALSFVVRQGDSTWQTGYFLTTADWQTYLFTPTAADWYAMPERTVPSPTPDFSSTGAPMTFGFWTGCGSAGGFGYARSGVFDNFAVTFIPSPSLAGVCPLLAPLMIRRARRS